MVKRANVSPKKDHSILIAFGIAVVLIAIVLSLPYIISQINISTNPTPPGFEPATNIGPSDLTITINTNTPAPPATIGITPTILIEASLMHTPSPFPTAFKGTMGVNLPDDFRVGPWHDNYIQCDKDPGHYEVTIYGVEISNGTPPYHFTFWQYTNTYVPLLKVETPSDSFIEFKEPVIISKGEYVHVVITFRLENGTNVTWIDDLYYHHLKDPKCK